MATIPTTSKITMSTDEENRTNYETDLSAKNTDVKFMLILVLGPLLTRKNYSI